MSSISTVERNAKILASWPAFWTGANSDTKGLTNLYHPLTGTLVDHAFNITRIGHNTLNTHWALWLAAIPDFTADVLHVQATAEGGWLVYRGKGTFENDLAGIFPATKRPFVNECALRAWIDEDGLITRSEEWYTRTFGESGPVDEYDVKSDGQ
jgi:hypothetical protein